MMAEKNARAMKSLAESPAKSRRLESKDQPATLGKTAESAPAARAPLGLRYSFLIRGVGEEDREVDAATASRTSESPRLTLETNHEAYLQIWKMAGSSPLQLLFPDQDSSSGSIRILAGQRQQIPWPQEGRSMTLLVRLSLIPFALEEQDPAMAAEPSRAHIQQSVEQATYVVNQDPSASRLSVRISLGSP
jgi:hypothetical protein